MGVGVYQWNAQDLLLAEQKLLFVLQAHEMELCPQRFLQPTNLQIHKK